MDKIPQFMQELTDLEDRMRRARVMAERNRLKQALVAKAREGNQYLKDNGLPYYQEDQSSAFTGVLTAQQKKDADELRREVDDILRGKGKRTLRYP
jgi:hypothetical protein